MKFFLNFSRPDEVNDASVKKLLEEQKIQWQEILERHHKEEWELIQTQFNEQRETLHKILETVHANQIKQLEAKYERFVFLSRGLYFFRINLVSRI